MRPSSGEPESANNPILSAYAGRWVAFAEGSVIGQGGTPQQALNAARASRYKETPQVFFVPYLSPLSMPEVLEQVANLLPAGVPAFLVGGAVRDHLLGHPVHDMDFALEGDVLNIARKVARALHADYYPLDEARQTARLILKDESGRRSVLDFAGLRGPDLESDLRARDFTVNAIAVDIRAPEALLDPLGGAGDLRSRVLRACSPSSITDDPLRILRAVRLAADFNLHILPETRTLIRKGVALLPQVSPERMRDELFRILEGRQPASSLRALEMLGVLPYTFPELSALKGVEQSSPHILDVWNHTLSVLQHLEAVFEALNTDYRQEAAANIALGLVSIQLGRYRQHLQEHLDTVLNPQRSLRGLLFLAALYHDIAKPQTRRVEECGRVRFFRHDQEGALLVAVRAGDLRLSNLEADRLATIIRHHLRPILLAQSEEMPSRRAIYRFFRDTGPAGVDVCLLSLADVLATHGPGLSIDTWRRHVDVVRALLEAWWEHREEQVHPPQILNGKEVMEALGLEPGPELGRLLEALREAQATGNISSRQEGLDYLRGIIEGRKES